jgi:hypothetical protein
MFRRFRKFQPLHRAQWFATIAALALKLCPPNLVLSRQLHFRDISPERILFVYGNRYHSYSVHMAMPA